MTSETVLVVDDDTALSEMLAMALRRAGYECARCERGDLAFAEFRRVQPDLVLLDLMLPGLSGLTVCGLIREESGVPIIMLTARGETADVVNGLESGADDYIVKPFKVVELIARVRAQLRPRAAEPSEPLSLGELEIDVRGRRVSRSGKVLALTPLEFDLLAVLARRPGRTFTRTELLAHVWGYQHTGDTRLVNVHVQRLRAKIEPDPEQPRYVLTVRGAGYRAAG